MTASAHEVLTQRQYEEIFQLVIQARRTARKDTEALLTGALDVQRRKVRDEDDAALKALCRYLVRLTHFVDDEPTSR